MYISWYNFVAKELENVPLLGCRVYSEEVVKGSDILFCNGFTKTNKCSFLHDKPDEAFNLLQNKNRF